MVHYLSVNLWIREQKEFQQDGQILVSKYYSGVLLPDTDKRHNNPNENIFLENILDQNEQDNPMQSPKTVAKAIVKGMIEDYQIPLDEIEMGSADVKVFSRPGKYQFDDGCVGKFQLD